MRTPSSLSELPKALPPHTIIFGIKLQYTNFGGGHTQTITKAISLFKKYCEKKCYGIIILSLGVISTIITAK